MANYIETVNDFRIKYAGTYVHVPSIEEVVGPKYAPIVRVSETFFNEDEEEASPDDTDIAFAEVMAFYLCDNKEGVQVTRPYSAVVPIDEIDFNPLNLGAVNLEYSTINLLSVVPDGYYKYRKLPSQGSVRVIDPFTNERSVLGPRYNVRIEDYNLLSAWASNTYTDVQTALDNVLEGRRLGEAFNSEYSFGICIERKGVYLYYNGASLFRVSDDKKIEVPKRYSWIAQELEYFGLLVKIID